MWSFLVVAQLLCAAVLILSGIAKAREPEATQDAFTALRLPRALADSPAPALLPWAEIALGALLLVTRGWPLALGLLATLGLFLAYWVIIKRALGFAEPVSCNCFGKIGDHSVSPRTLVRNTLLVGTALAGLVGPLLGVSTLDLLLHRPEDLGWVLAAALAAAVALFVLGGSADPDQAPTARGALSRMSLQDPASGQLRTVQQLGDTVLLFMSPGCGGCIRVAENLPRWREELPRITFRPVYHSAIDPKGWDLPGVLDDHLLDHGGNVGIAAAGGSTPVAVLLDRHGNVVGEPVLGSTDVIEMVTRLGAQPEPEPEPAADLEQSADGPAPLAQAPALPEETDELDYVRQPIPSAVVVNSGGEAHTLTELAQTGPALVVAITCLCGSSAAVLPQLETWAKRLEVVDVVLLTTFALSSLPAEPDVAERAHYDHRGLASQALGLAGTPTAVLLGADGMIAGGPVGPTEIESFVTDIEAELVEYGVLTRDA